MIDPKYYWKGKEPIKQSNKEKEGDELLSLERKIKELRRSKGNKDEINTLSNLYDKKYKEFMRKNRIKLNENTLRKIIKRTLNEAWFKNEEDNLTFHDDTGISRTLKTIRLLKKSYNQSLQNRDGKNMVSIHQSAINLQKKISFIENELNDLENYMSHFDTLRNNVIKETREEEMNYDWDNIDDVTNDMQGTYDFDDDEDFYAEYGPNSYDDGGAASMSTLDSPEEFRDYNNPVPSGFSEFDEYPHETSQERLDGYLDESIKRVIRKVLR